ncbi:hypothetical protein M501DRAFT_937898 [Patellaria atrata CBS 101060]|uniref:DNA repair protein Rad26 n=1 Tax=Patellaria atrata CBS 101060 TaxID=1346257 RepID=A0A9P4S7M3_9PEZI|nr:hypothetical protein M501DRAFT_937898 [Patellaria atrata CBS 101060]
MDYQDEGFDRQGHTFEGGNITSNTQINLAEMQQRIAELEREKEALIKSNEDAKNTALSKAGEIAIVRRNQEKSTKEYERRISVMQKLHADALSKQKSELENIKKEKEKMETSNRFLEHDLVQEAGKAKASRRLLREPSGPRPGGSANSSPAATPKKHRTLPFRDGFDDEDLVMTSPSKTRERTKASTPRAGSKRKRPIEDSPSLELPLSEPRSLPQLIREESQLAPDIDSNALARLSAEGRKFKFLQRLLTHRPPEQRETILESLTKFAYPSDPNQSLASRIYDQLTILAVGKDHDDFPRKFILVVISLWRQCVAERYFAPLYLILDALQFLLAYEPMATRASLVEDITPLAIATADVVAIPIGRASKNPTAASNKDGPLHRQHCAEIDVYECLLVLHTTVLSCVTSPTQLITFWQLISYDFILLMLMSAQPLPQIMLMLRLLTTSPLFNTFGAILPGLETTPQQQHQQSVNEANTIERLTLLLHETPKPAEEDATPYSALEIAELRLAVLDVFASMTLSPHAGRALALHRTALARLVRFLQDAINALYAYHLLTHNLTTRAVNLSIKLIFLLCTNFKEEVNIREKLSAVPGASHKFLVALTRLAFSEQVCLEEGIEEESGEMAHGLLDECLSPEEGEALLEVFSNVGSG